MMKLLTVNGERGVTGALPVLGNQSSVTKKELFLKVGKDTQAKFLSTLRLQFLVLERKRLD